MPKTAILILPQNPDVSSPIIITTRSIIAIVSSC